MWLTDLRIVLTDGIIDRGSVRIEDEHIAEIMEGPASNNGETLFVNCGGLTAIPGIVDVHGDMLEREIEPRPGAQFPTAMALLELDKRLAATGVTTAFATITFADLQSRGIRSADRAREIISTVTGLRDVLLVDFKVHARFDINYPNAAPTLADLLSTGQVHLVSLNDHTPGQGQYRDLEVYIDFISKWRNISIEEAQQLAAQRLERAKTAPPSWEITQSVTRLATERGLPIASHDDDKVAKVELVASLGATISEFPVTIEAATEARRRGMHVVVGSPNALRGSSLTGNLSAMEAIEAGLVDILAADYYPAALLQSAFSLSAKSILPLHEAVKLISQNPANAVGLADRGSLEVGKAADVVLVEDGDCPRVRGTLRNGAPIYWDGSMARRTHKQLALVEV